MKINEKSLYVFASSAPHDYDGFLNKRGEINKFLRRYFVLKGNLLFYFEKKGDKEPLGLIIVEGCTIELSEESDLYCFQMTFNGNRTYILSADSQESMESWMKALTCAGYEYKKLIVAELQHKLEEIESSSRKIIGKQFTSKLVLPNPPPRRQNPFNRPSPPLSVLRGSCYNTSVFINGHLEVTSEPNKHYYTGSDLNLQPPSKGLPLVNRPHDLQKDLRFNLEPSCEVQNSKTSNFEQFHEKFRQLVMEDVQDYHADREMKSKPLIEL